MSKYVRHILLASFYPYLWKKCPFLKLKSKEDILILDYFSRKNWNIYGHSLDSLAQHTTGFFFWVGRFSTWNQLLQNRSAHDCRSHGISTTNILICLQQQFFCTKVSPNKSNPNNLYMELPYLCTLTLHQRVLAEP